jgi:hypothetical protein
MLLPERMEDADVICCWERCKTMGEALGLSAVIVSDTIQVNGQYGGKNMFYTCNTARELRGYMEGLAKLAGSRTEP